MDGMNDVVAIRVDSSEQIGSGHLMRCLTLAEQLRKQSAEVHFICRDLVGSMHALVYDHDFRLHLLPRHEANPALTGYAAWLTVPQTVDAEETEAILHQLRPVERLVVDSYALDAAWEQKMRPLVREIFVIDDLANRPHDCDVLLDQNFYREMRHRYDGLVPPDCKLMLGPPHALLREEFYAARAHLRERDGRLRRILVFYGGSDATCETEKAIHALLQLYLPSVDVDVVVGGSNPHCMIIEEICAAHDLFHYHCQVSNMAELMANADLGLGAGGTTSWERCFLGLPTIVTAIAENQFEVCRDCAEAGLIHYLGKWDEVTAADLMRAVSKYMNPKLLKDFQQTCSIHM